MTYGDRLGLRIYNRDFGLLSLCIARLCSEGRDILREKIEVEVNFFL